MPMVGPAEGELRASGTGQEASRPVAAALEAAHRRPDVAGDLIVGGIAGRALSEPGVVRAVGQHLSGPGAAYERARSMRLS